jgi:HEAT repeat protein
MRESAARALGQVGHGNAHVIDALLKSLSDYAWQVRSVAPAALGQLGQGEPRVIDALLKTLSNSSGFLTKTIARVLLALRIDHLEISSFIDSLLQQYDPILRRQLVADARADAFLFALQQIVEEVR